MSEGRGAERSLEYNTDLFDRTDYGSIARAFSDAIRRYYRDPDPRIADLPMPQAEQHQLLIEWNDTQRDYPKDKCIHQLFEEQVEKTPETIAVVFEEKQLTYQELNERANRMAHYLSKLGVKAETKVGICVERSVEMVIGLLGILKAGGAYVPLDPGIRRND